MKLLKNIIAIFILSLMFSLTSKAGEVKADVVVDLQQIPQELRIHVNSMENDLERYINNNKFTDLEWEGPPIPMNISIVLSGGNNNVFSARMFLGSQRYIYGKEGGTSTVFRFIDNTWRFEYAQGAMFSFNLNQFDRITSVLNFYIYMIIGMDLDTYGPLDGNFAYDVARQIANMGSGNNVDGFSNFAQPGEFTRWNLVSELTDPRYENFRLLIYDYYVDGLDFMVEDREAAMLNLVDIIADMAEFKRTKMVGPSVLVESFFMAKNEELAAMFKGYDNPKVFQDLIYLDPSNTQMYEAASRGESYSR